MDANKYELRELGFKIADLLRHSQIEDAAEVNKAIEYAKKVTYGDWCFDKTISTEANTSLK